MYAVITLVILLISSKKYSFWKYYERGKSTRFTLYVTTSFDQSSLGYNCFMHYFCNVCLFVLNYLYKYLQFFELINFPTVLILIHIYIYFANRSFIAVVNTATTGRFIRKHDTPDPSTMRRDRFSINFISWRDVICLMKPPYWGDLTRDLRHEDSCVVALNQMKTKPFWIDCTGKSN